MKYAIVQYMADNMKNFVVVDYNEVPHIGKKIGQFNDAIVVEVKGKQWSIKVEEY